MGENLPENLVSPWVCWRSIEMDVSNNPGVNRKQLGLREGGDLLACIF